MDLNRAFHLFQFATTALSREYRHDIERTGDAAQQYLTAELHYLRATAKTAVPRIVDIALGSMLLFSLVVGVVCSLVTACFFYLPSSVPTAQPVLVFTLAILTLMTLASAIVFRVVHSTREVLAIADTYMSHWDKDDAN